MTAVLPPPVLVVGGVSFTGYLPAEGSLTADWEVSSGEDALLSGLFAGQTSSAGASAATLTLTAADGYLIPQALAGLLEAIRPGQIVQITETYTRPDMQRTWVNCQVLTASVRHVGTLPGRTGAWYTYAFTFRWRRAT